MSRRGSIVLVALPGDYGKPRPAVIVQADSASDLQTRVVCPFTSDVREETQLYRPIVDPSPTNGLRGRSQVMVDKPHVVALAKLGEPIGNLESPQMHEVGTSLVQLLGLA